MTREEEIGRLNGVPGQFDSALLTMRVPFTIHCDGNSTEVLARVKEVLTKVVSKDPESWPTADEWRSIFPVWFVQQSVAFDTTLSSKRSDNRRWSIEGFVFWFLPDERSWYWWDAKIEDPNLFTVEVIAEDLPFAWGALEWLFRAAGALKIDSI